MKRRSFFGWTAAAAGAAAIPARAGATQGHAQHDKVIRTAVTIRVDFSNYEPHEMPVDMPAGFIPIALSVTGRSDECFVRLFDDEGDLIQIHALAFSHGPIDFWREYRGLQLRCEVTSCEHYSVLPCPVVTIYGEIDID